MRYPQLLPAPGTARERRLMSTGEIGRLSTEALVNLLAAWCVRHAATRHAVPRYCSLMVAEVIRRLGPGAALGRCRIRCAQLVLALDAATAEQPVRS